MNLAPRIFKTDQNNATTGIYTKKLSSCDVPVDISLRKSHHINELV